MSEIGKVFCQEVIISTLSIRGNGTKENPYRTIVQVFTKSGELIAEKDEWKEAKELEKEG